MTDRDFSLHLHVQGEDIRGEGRWYYVEARDQIGTSMLRSASAHDIETTFLGRGAKQRAQRAMRLVIEKWEKPVNDVADPRWYEPTVCPRCGKTKPPQYPALSRLDNESYICGDCGMEEATWQDAGVPMTKADWFSSLPGGEKT